MPSLETHGKYIIQNIVSCLQNKWNPQFTFTSEWETALLIKKSLVITWKCLVHTYHSADIHRPLLCYHRSDNALPPSLTHTQKARANTTLKIVIAGTTEPGVVEHKQDGPGCWTRHDGVKSTDLMVASTFLLIFFFERGG